MIKVVFDTVIFVRSLLNPHSFCGQFFSRYNYKFRLFVSQPIIAEILEVIQRPAIKKKYKTDEIDWEKMLTILSQAENVRLEKVEKICRDEKDDIFLATALACKANFLITEDKDLLTLKSYQKVKIIDSASFLKIISVKVLHFSQKPPRRCLNRKKCKTFVSG